MKRDYSKFLSAKLYFIESLALKEKLKGSEVCSKIHKICLMSPSEFIRMMEEQ